MLHLLADNFNLCGVDSSSYPNKKAEFNCHVRLPLAEFMGVMSREGIWAMLGDYILFCWKGKCITHCTATYRKNYKYINFNWKQNWKLLYVKRKGTTFVFLLYYHRNVACIAKITSLRKLVILSFTISNIYIILYLFYNKFY